MLGSSVRLKIMVIYGIYYDRQSILSVMFGPSLRNLSL